MLTIQHITSNILEITVTGALKAEDFKEFGEQADALIQEYDHIRILINASDFDGWENRKAAEKHFSFVKGHHEKVERLAIVTGHMWQHWLVALAQVFVHPKVKILDRDQLEDAREWLKK